MPRKLLFGILKAILVPIALAYVKDIRGLEKLPKSPYVIAANHNSFIDPAVIMAIFLRHFNIRVSYLTKKEVFDNFFKRLFFEVFGAIPLDRQNKDNDALQNAIKWVNQGGLVGLFPEGVRSPDGRIHRGKTGAVRIALKSRCPIVPIGLVNNYELWPRHRKLPKFRKIIEVRIGDPIRLDKHYKSKITKKLLREITDKIMLKIAGLSGQEYVP